MSSSLDPIVALSARALSREIHRGALSCREVMQAYLGHIGAHNPQVNAIVALRDADALMAEAAAADEALAAGKSMGWMHGMPQAPKDLAMTRGLRTTFGSPIFRDNVPTSDGIVVERARQAGALFVGKTNTPEFGLGSHTFNPVYGATRNPYDGTRSAGGSSGGAAAALAMRMLPVADGSDIGGSLRNPAAFCNVYGFRPSAGRVPYGPTPETFLPQLGTEGPMARSVADLALLLATQAGPDVRTPQALPTDPTLATLTPDNVEGSLAADLSGARIAWLGDWGGHLAIEDGILSLCEAALASMAAFGVQTEAVAPPFPAERIWKTWLAHRHFLTGNSRMALYRNPETRAQLKPEAIWEIEGALPMTATELYAASTERTAWYQALQRLFTKFDYVAVPTAQVFPFDIDARWPTAIAGRDMDTYHRWMEVVVPWTLAGAPVINVPVGFGAEGLERGQTLPMGMQLIGRPRADWSVLQLAAAYERERDWVGRHLPPAIA